MLALMLGLKTKQMYFWGIWCYPRMVCVFVFAAFVCGFSLRRSIAVSRSLLVWRRVTFYIKFFGIAGRSLWACMVCVEWEMVKCMWERFVVEPNLSTKHRKVCDKCTKHTQYGGCERVRSIVCAKTSESTRNSMVMF